MINKLQKVREALEYYSCLDLTEDNVYYIEREIAQQAIKDLEDYIAAQEKREVE